MHSSDSSLDGDDDIPVVADSSDDDVIEWCYDYELVATKDSIID